MQRLAARIALHTLALDSTAQVLRALQACLVSTALLPVCARLRKPMGNHQWAFLPVKSSSEEGYAVKGLQSEV